MLTKSLLKREIDSLGSIISKLAEYSEQHNEHLTDLDSYLDQLDTKLRDLDGELNKLVTSYSREICEVNLQLDKLWNSIATLDSFTQEVDSKLYMLECKTEFLDHNKDALEMWIECVRQTQQLYADSQKAEVTE